VGVSGQAITFQQTGDPLKLQTFTETPEGNWRTIIKTPNGEEPWEYEPGTKFTPTLRSELTLLDAGKGQVRYTYHIGNDANSQQQITHVNIGPNVPLGVAIHRAPLDWYTWSNPGWLTAEAPDESRGIRPGTSDTIEIEMQMLPSVAEVKLWGKAELANEVPDGLTARQYEELHLLFDRYQLLSLPAITPTVGYSSDLPQETIRALLPRAIAEFQVALLKDKYPYRRELTEIIERSLTTQDFRSEVMRFKGITQRSVADPWHQDISNALGIYADVILVGLSK
jgi:hypothetical protein